MDFAACLYQIEQSTLERYKVNNRQTAKFFTKKTTEPVVPSVRLRKINDRGNVSRQKLLAQLPRPPLWEND